MPDPKDNAKATGDTHPPEVESDMPMQEGSDGALGADGTPSDRGRATESGMEGKPGRGINQAGLLKDKDEETSGSPGSTRDPGERSSGKGSKQ
jgi:hypothetical protein